MPSNLTRLPQGSKIALVQKRCNFSKKPSPRLGLWWCNSPVQGGRKGLFERAGRLWVAFGSGLGQVWVAFGRPEIRFRRPEFQTAVALGPPLVALLLEPGKNFPV